MSWLLFAVVGLVLAWLLMPSLFRRDGAAPLGASQAEVLPTGGATVTQFPRRTVAALSPMATYGGSASGYMGVSS